MSSPNEAGMVRAGDAHGKARKTWVRRLGERLKGRPDSEHEQALIRLVIGALLFVYLLPGAVTHTGEQRETDILYLGVMLMYLAFAVGTFVAIVVQPGVSRLRRITAALVDTGTVTFFLVNGGELAAPLFLVYVWVTLANGFRFGAPYLVASLVFSVAGFWLALEKGPYWSMHPDLGVGLMIGMIALALYVLTLVKRMFAAVARAESANRAKRRFISVVSHEMRTPLNAIINMTELLRDTRLDREQVDMVQTLSGSSRVLLGLVEDVLDFSKIEAGKLAVERGAFDLHALINSTVKILTRQAEDKGLELVVSIMPQVPPALRGDAHHLRQILINLVGNAIKFTERGSVTVHVSLLSESDSEAQLKFSVRDTGIGIAPDAQQRIFESFTQADDSTTRRFGGTGLGTTIAKQLVELMGGRMGLESAVGLGSTFWFELPLAKQAQQDEPARGELADARILLIGFGDSEGAVLEQMLGGWGAKPVRVESLEQAAERSVRDIATAPPWHSALLWRNLVVGAAADLKRLRDAVHQPALPVVVVVPASMGNSQESLGGGRNSLLEWPVEHRLVFNALHSTSVEIEERSEVVFLSDYLKRRDSSRSLKVLVADDNAANRTVISKILDRAGHVVELVDDGDAALDAVERGRFDLVILDRNMPHMGGADAVRALRVLHTGPERLPVIILSADATPESRQECLDAGADAFLSKPLEAARLVQTVADLTTSRPTSRPAPVLRPVAPARSHEMADAPAVLNRETIELLEELGSGSDFMEKLISAFIKDAQHVLNRLEYDPGYVPAGEFRSLVHALKGSVSSIGADRLTQACSRISEMPDAQIRVEGQALGRMLRDEFELVRQALVDYLSTARRTAG